MEREGSVPTIEYIKKVGGELRTILRRHGGDNLRLFGSVAKGTSTLSSDVDFLIDFPNDKTFFDLGFLLDEMEEVVGFPVELYTLEMLPTDVRERVEKSYIQI